MNRRKALRHSGLAATGTLFGSFLFPLLSIAAADDDRLQPGFRIGNDPRFKQIADSTFNGAPYHEAVAADGGKISVYEYLERPLRRLVPRVRGKPHYGLERNV